MSILIVGSMALDTVKTPAGRHKEILGGSATYSSVSAGFFNPVRLVAVVGKDFPKKHIRFLKNHNIDLTGLEIKQGKTFRWEGEYGWDFSDPKTLLTELNVLGSFNPGIPDKYKNSRYVFLANIDPKAQMRVLKQIKNPKLIMCDTMNYWIQNSRKDLLKVLKQTNIFLLNESEARQLTSENNLLLAAKAIKKMGPATIIIKKGEHGAVLFSQKSFFCIPAFLLESIIDPTGAGDTFAGGIIGFLSTVKKINNASLKSAVIYGSIMATFAVEDFSLRRLDRINKHDISRRVKEFKKYSCF